MTELMFKWAFLLSIVTVLGLPTALYISDKHDQKKLKQSKTTHPTHRKKQNEN